MRTAPTHAQGTERTDRCQPPGGTAGGPPLSDVGRVPWREIQDSTGSAAAIPVLLDDVAGGDDETAQAALAELRERICQYGFVVEQATAATVPFLWELAQLPHVTCRPEIIRLLRSIADARQWENTAEVYPKLLNHRENHVVWERRARQAVRDRRGALRRLMTEPDADITRATAELARTLDESVA